MDQKAVSRPWLPFVITTFYRWIIARAALLIGLVAGATFLAMLVLRLYLVTAYVPELGGIESNVIYSLQRILDGYPLYVDPATPPYSITQYTPLYYYLCWGVGRIFGVDAANVHHVYVLSRSVSLLLNLLFAWSVFAILRNVFRVKRSVSLLALVYAFVYLDEESFSRPDSLFNLLALLTVGLFLKLLTEEDQPRSRWYLVGASALSVVAIFAKQSAIYLPILLLFYLVFFLQNFRWAMIALLTITATFGLLLVLSGQNDFHTFFQNTVQGVNNGASLSWFVERIMVEHFQKERFINILGLFGGFHFLAKGKSHPLKFLGLALLGSFSFALITSIKIGAAPNYFTEFIVLTVIAVVVLVATYDPWFRAQPIRRGKWKGYQPLFYLILIAFTLPPRFAGKFHKKVVKINNVGQSGYLDDQAVAHYMYEELHLQPDDQVFITTHVHNYLNKFLYKNAIFPQKEIVVANPPNTYDYSAFYRGVQDGTVDYVIASLSERHVDTVGQDIKIRFDFIGTDFSSYIPVKQMGDYLIFRHKRPIDR